MLKIPGWPYGESPFHAGEQYIQSRLGVRDAMEVQGRAVIRDFMSEQQQLFYQGLLFLLVGSLDARGQPWASVLVGLPGFAHALDERHLRIDIQPANADPLRDNLRLGAALGLLGIDPVTRRRNRLNGMLCALDEGGMTVGVQRSFGNCPKYIQTRVPRPHEAPPMAGAGALAVTHRSLGEAQQRIVHQADTFYIASSFSDTALASGCPHGMDISHRGGKPGFVRVDDSHTLTVPDFAGNNYFNTLGNLLLQPKVGLLFMDFESGDLLYVAAQADIMWEGPEVAAFTGAQRLLRFHISETRWVRNALPLRWSAVGLSPFLQSIGSWPSGAR